MKLWNIFLRISSRPWLSGLLVGFSFALVLTLIVTLWEWLENPSQIFHDAQGTHWSFVVDTALSWFLPTFFYGVLIAWLALFISRKLFGKDP